MKVILLQDVKSLGKKGEIVDINEGYARNYIMPKKLGVEADSKHLNDLKLKKANEEKVAKEQYEDALALKEKVEAGIVNVTIKSGSDGRTFGSISTKDIAQAAVNQLALGIDKKKIHMEGPIRTLGVHNVTVKLHPKVSAQLRVKVNEA